MFFRSTEAGECERNSQNCHNVREAGGFVVDATEDNVDGQRPSKPLSFGNKELHQ